MNWVGAFTYALCYGNGYDELGGSFLGGLYCDSNSDNLISLAECYSYAYTQAKNINSDQNAQVYPTGSNFTLWGK